MTVLSPTQLQDIFNGSVLNFTMKVGSLEQKVESQVLSQLYHLNQEGYSGDWVNKINTAELSFLNPKDSFASQLKAISAEWFDRQGKDMYGIGLRKAAANLGIKPAWGVMHSEALQFLRDHFLTRVDAASDATLRSIHDIFYKVGMAGATAMVSSGASVATASSLMEKYLRDQGITAFVDKSGHQWSLQKYCTMVARTTSAQAYIHGSANKYEEEGVDLVRVGGRTPEPGVSSDAAFKYFDKVLSISGKTKGFPTLAEAESEGLLHPNNWRDLIPISPEEAATLESTTKEGEQQEETAASPTSSHTDHEKLAQEWYERHVNVADSDVMRSIERSDSDYSRSIRARAKKYGMSQDDYIEQATAVQQKIVDAAIPKIGVSSDNLDGILESGRYKTQFETNTSGGSLGPGYRSMVEHALFDLPTDMDVEYRPVYGFMSDDSYNRVFYGNGTLNLVLKDTVRERSTIVPEDSFGLVRGLSDGTLGGAGIVAPDALSHLTGTALNPYISNPLACKSIHDLIVPGTYMEVQIHGGVTLADVDAIEISDPNIIKHWKTVESFMSDTQDETCSDIRNVLKKAQEKGLKIVMGKLTSRGW